MAFLSLGLNIDEPQSPEALQNARKELGNDVVIDSSSALVDGKEAQERAGSPNKAPDSGTSGTAAKNLSDSIELEKDNWPEMGMQIIQSVLRDAQKTQADASSGRPSEDISDLPPIEELRKKILEGIIPDFRATPNNGHPPNGSSPDALPHTDSQKQS